MAQKQFKFTKPTTVVNSVTGIPLTLNAGTYFLSDQYSVVTAATPTAPTSPTAPVTTPTATPVAPVSPAPTAPATPAPTAATAPTPTAAPTTRIVGGNITQTLDAQGNITAMDFKNPAIGNVPEQSFNIPVPALNEVFFYGGTNEDPLDMNLAIRIGNQTIIVERAEGMGGKSSRALKASILSALGLDANSMSRFTIDAFGEGGFEKGETITTTLNQSLMKSGNEGIQQAIQAGIKEITDKFVARVNEVQAGGTVQAAGGAAPPPPPGAPAAPGVPPPPAGAPALPPTPTTIPFRDGLGEGQKDSITNLLTNKPVVDWNDIDIANWNFATNKAPLPWDQSIPVLDISGAITDEQRQAMADQRAGAPLPPLGVPAAPGVERKLGPSEFDQLRTQFGVSEANFDQFFRRDDQGNIYLKADAPITGPDIGVGAGVSDDPGAPAGFNVDSFKNLLADLGFKQYTQDELISTYTAVMKPYLDAIADFPEAARAAAAPVAAVYTSIAEAMASRPSMVAEYQKMMKEAKIPEAEAELARLNARANMLEEKLEELPEDVKERVQNFLITQTQFDRITKAEADPLTKLFNAIARAATAKGALLKERKDEISTILDLWGKDMDRQDVVLQWALEGAQSLADLEISLLDKGLEFSKVAAEMGLAAFEAVRQQPGEILDLFKTRAEIDRLTAPDVPDDPASVREYQFAVQQGYTGSFVDWKNLGKKGTGGAAITTGIRFMAENVLAQPPKDQLAYFSTEIPAANKEEVATAMVQISRELTNIERADFTEQFAANKDDPEYIYSQIEEAMAAGDSLHNVTEDLREKGVSQEIIGAALRIKQQRG